MAIVENEFRARLGGDFSPLSRDSMLSDDGEFRSQSSLFESDVDAENDDEDEDKEEEEEYDDEEDDVDSGAGSDDYDLSDLGEIGAEFCQVGNRNCSLPLELYDLPDLTEVLSLDTWNNFLTEDERFSLAEYLPDMDQVTFARTLKELFAASNFNFGSPLTQLFNLLKGGLCEPRVALYHRGLNFLEKRRHYHLLRKYQNSMVSNIIQIRDAWEDCAAYSIEERLRLLNILRSKKSLMYEGYDKWESETDSSGREESINGLWTKRGKDGRLAVKSNSYTVYNSRPSVDVSSQARAMTLKPGKYKKQNLKGILNVTAPKASSKKDYTSALGCMPSVSHGLQMKSRPSILLSSLHRPDRAAGYDMSAVHHSLGYSRAEDDEGEEAHGIGAQKNRSMVHGVSVSKVNPLVPGRRGEFLRKYDSDLHIRQGEEDTESYNGMPFPVKKKKFPSNAKSKTTKVMELTGKRVNSRYYEYEKKAKYPKKLNQASVADWVKPAKAARLLSKGSRVDLSASSQPSRCGKTQEEALSFDNRVKFDDWNFKSKKWKMAEELKAGKKSAGLDSKIRTYKTSSPHMNEPYFQSVNRARTSEEKVGRNYAQNGGLKMEDRKISPMFAQNEETESDSSQQADKDEDIVHSTRRFGYPSGTVGGGLSASVMSANDPKRINKTVRKVKNEYEQALDGALQAPVKFGALGQQLNVPEIEIFSSKGNKRGKMSEPSYLHDLAIEHMGRNLYNTTKSADDRKKKYKSMDSQMQGGLSERSKFPSLKACPERKLKGKVDADNSVPGSNYMQRHDSEVLGECDLHVAPKLVDKQARSNVSGKKGQMVEAHATGANINEISVTASGCNSVTRKRKGKIDLTHVDGSDEPDYQQPSSTHHNDEADFSKKRVKKKMGDEPSYSPMVTSDVLISERGMPELETETKPVKKPFTLITPSIHTGFSFSIIHLLTAVRMAMITVHAEDSLDVGKHLEMIEGREKHKDGLGGASELFPSHEDTHMTSSEQMAQKNVPSLTVLEIVERVRSNPGDPCILETQEPLQDLIRGVLKIYSSKTAPLGAKGWKPLVFYEKSTKSWSWVGPVSSPSDHDTAEEETSAEAWVLPHKMLVKLVDSFANWLKSGQETLKLIGSLPPPPELMPSMDEKERFKDLRAQKSLVTINPSSDEVRAYFRKEEYLRYSIPDRAFSYTAADGRKSTVAPLRRCGGKPTSKARDHFMLKPDRPPHVTILCLVRDAAARLPGSIGTRADVCTLIRDSQYIVEDVSDAQVNQVVSGALDRLHYERDPCVQFDGERKLWVYLHRDREEEDFEDDGTSSTKKWKRPRKEPPDPSYTRAPDDVVYQESGDQAGGGSATGYDPGSGLNVEPSGAYAEVKTELMYNDSRPDFENIEQFIDSEKGSMDKGHPSWGVIELNPSREGKLLCQENSTNEDFDDEAFSRDRPLLGF